MNSNEIIGMLIVAGVSLGGFITLIWKCFKPISDLNLNIVKLTSTIEALINNDTRQDMRLETHGKEIDKINVQLGKHDERIKNLENI
jgi:hypothetical protein